jgi:DNA topoisomerase-1
MAQIGTAEDEEKPVFASLLPDQSLDTISFEEALDLFKLPRTLGTYKDEELQANVGRFGPYVKFGKKFVSIPATESAMDISLDRAIELVKEKEAADAPIYNYQGKDVSKGVGRFGPFIKWDGMFINVNKKYDFDNLSNSDIETLIEEKLQKEREKLIHHWEEEGIRVEKARWGRHHVIKGKVKVELAKTIDVSDMTLEEAQKLLEQKAPKKKRATKKTTAKKTKNAPKKN